MVQIIYNNMMHIFWEICYDWQHLRKIQGQRVHGNADNCSAPQLDNRGQDPCLTSDVWNKDGLKLSFFFPYPAWAIRDLGLVAGSLDWADHQILSVAKAPSLQPSVNWFAMSNEGVFIKVNRYLSSNATKDVWEEQS